MNSLWSKIEPILLRVQQPAQYIGNEVNSIVKDHSKVALKIVIAFPDTYSIGMSHLGLQILYGLLNARTDILAERAFAPWLDMEKIMRQEKIPLFTMETHSPVKEFDIIGFSLQHELCYTNLINMLDLAGIPLLSKERAVSDPLILAGGPCAFYPEPLADFVDLFLLGDGEEAILELSDELIRIKKGKGTDRNEIIKQLVKKVPGLYAPSLYNVSYKSDNTIEAIKPIAADIPERISGRAVKDLDNAFYPVKPVVPFVDTVHNRISLEIMRGCPHACRFCVSNVIKSPLRFRSVKKLISLAETIYQNTGYDEISLLSLSSGDYPDLDELLLRLTARFKARRVGLSLPSLHINEQLKKLPAVLNAVRKAGFTLAPETGREHLRRIINKPIEDKDFYEAVTAAYQQGWKSIKLYFMIGLPGETEEDIYAIIEMIKKASVIGKQIRGIAGNINVTISPFSPKPHTPFQWLATESPEQLKNKQELIKKNIRSGRIRLKFHKSKRSFLEAAFALGDRKLGKVLLTVWQNGAKFDSWDETFDFERWMDAFQQNDISPDFYARRSRHPDEILPWSHLETNTSLPILLKDYQESLKEMATDKKCAV